MFLGETRPNLTAARDAHCVRTPERQGVRRRPGAGVELAHRLNVGGFAVSELEQLEQQVLRLSPEDLAKFRAWFIELDHQLWDKQIETDVAAGKLDRLITEARAEFKAPKASRRGTGEQANP